jgi:hypothetical protein
VGIKPHPDSLEAVLHDVCRKPRVGSNGDVVANVHHYPVLVLWGYSRQERGVAGQVEHAERGRDLRFGDGRHRDIITHEKVEENELLSLPDRKVFNIPRENVKRS